MFIVLVTIALALATFVGWLRDRSFVGGLVGTILYIVVPTAMWLIVSWFLPHAADCQWWDLLPGAVVFGVGVEALHVFTVYWIAHEVSTKSDTYGALGTSLALLLWAYLLGRLIVAAANLERDPLAPPTREAKPRPRPNRPRNRARTTGNAAFGDKLRPKRSWIVAKTRGQTPSLRARQMIAVGTDGPGSAERTGSGSRSASTR